MDSLISDEKHFNDETSTTTPHKYCSYAGPYTLIRKIQMGGQAWYNLKYLVSTFHKKITPFLHSKSIATAKHTSKPIGMKSQYFKGWIGADLYPSQKQQITYQFDGKAINRP